MNKKNTTIKLYNVNVSPPCRAIVQLLLEKSISFEKIDVNLIEDEQFSEEYTKINPNQKVPALIDENKQFTQSSTILRYIATKYNLPEYPQDPSERLKIDNCLDFFSIDFNVYFNHLFAYQGVIPSYTFENKTVDIKQEIINKFKPYRDRVLAEANRLLGESQYFCGESITIADYLGNAYRRS